MAATGLEGVTASSSTGEFEVSIPRRMSGAIGRGGSRRAVARHTASYIATLASPAHDVKVTRGSGECGLPTVVAVVAVVAVLAVVAATAAAATGNPRLSQSASPATIEGRMSTD